MKASAMETASCLIEPNSGLRGKRLREVDFVFEGQPSRKTIRDTKIVLRGIEQNPKTESRWAQMARAGHKVMQFLSAGRYVGNVVDSKVTLYGGKKKSSNEREPKKPRARGKKIVTRKSGSARQEPDSTKGGRSAITKATPSGWPQKASPTNQGKGSRAGLKPGVYTRAERAAGRPQRLKPL
jgi:hypothetical protein